MTAGKRRTSVECFYSLGCWRLTLVRVRFPVVVRHGNDRDQIRFTMCLTTMLLIGSIVTTTHLVSPSSWLARSQETQPPFCDTNQLSILCTGTFANSHRSGKSSFKRQRLRPRITAKRPSLLLLKQTSSLGSRFYRNLTTTYISMPALRPENLQKGFGGYIHSSFVFHHGFALLLFV